MQRARGRLTVKQVEAALRASAGIQSIAAERLKVSPATVCRFIQKNPQLSAVIDEVTDEICDLAIAKLIANIRAGDMKAITYYLDNKGQARGYGQRKLAFKDGDGNVAVPAVLVTGGKMGADEWEARFGQMAAAKPA